MSFCSLIVHLFLSLNNIPLLCLSIDFQKDILVASMFWQSLINKAALNIRAQAFMWTEVSYSFW